MKWMWSPAFGGHTGLFPGSRYVDMLGLTCLNPGKTRQGGHWRSFTTICTRPIGELHALTPGLPIQLSEVGTSAAGGNQAAWIAGMFAFLRAHPEVSSLVWFNVRKTAYRVLEGSRPAQRAFALGLRGGVRTARTA